MSLSSWYHVSFDEEYIYRDVDPPDRENWNDRLYWTDIIRVCFKQGAEFFETDELYIFTNKQEASYLIPLEADGGLELWNEIIQRDLFDAELAIKIATGSNELHCWPEDKGS